MDSKEIESKVKEIGKKVAEVSKSAFDKASVKVQDFTDKSILKIDIKKLQVKQNELYKNLGEIVSKFLLSLLLSTTYSIKSYDLPDSPLSVIISFVVWYWAPSSLKILLIVNIFSSVI